MELSNKIIIILLFSAVLLIPQVSKGYIKSHPLSEIHPTDTNLNMSNGTFSYNITNVRVINPSNDLRTGSKLIVGGNLDIRNNDILNVSHIENFFSSACEERKVVDRVYSNGSYSCVAVDEEITDIWVNETGDTMSGNLSMSGNKILQVSDPDGPQDAATKSYVDIETTNVNESATQTLEEVLGEGNYAGNYSINMQGNNITSISYLNTGSELNIGSSLNIWGNANLNSFDLYGAEYINASEFYDDGESLTSKYLDVSGDSMEGTLDFGSNPFTIDTSSKISNLNADLLDSEDGSYYLNASNINSGILDNQYIDLVQNEIPSLGSNWTETIDSEKLTDLEDLNYEILLYPSNITNEPWVEGDENLLNVNSSKFWDNLDNVSDISGLLDTQIENDLTSNLTKSIGLIYNDQIANLSDSKITGSGEIITNLNADLLDGVELADINWNNVSMEQTDINLSDLGSANTNLNMNDYNITNIAHLLNYFDSACSPGSALYNIQENGSFECISISGETHELYVNESGDVMSGNLSLGGYNINNVNLVDGIDLENPGSGLTVSNNRYVALLGDSIETAELGRGSVTNSKIAIGAINKSQVSFAYANSSSKGGAASNAIQLNGQPSIYYLNETTNAGGDLSGNFSNLQLGSGVVDSNEIASNSVGNDELDNSSSFTLAELIVSGRVQVQGDLDVFGNITNTEVNHLNVNGSLLPPERYNNTFNIGNQSRQWKDLYIADDIHVGGYVDGIDLSKAGDGLGISGNRYYVKNGTGISVTPGGVIHQDTSSQGNISNGGAIVIQNITLDQFGHIKEIDPKNLNVIYYTKSDASSLFVNKTGDTMDGELKMNDDIDLNGNSIKSTDEICIGNECN